nr:NADPH:quinone oxidoreductase family protein [Wenxinia marina]
MRDVAEPVPAQGQALVRIAACGLNFADLLMADGRYQQTPEPPFTLGLEVAGEVLTLGPGTDGPPPGTRVAIYAGSGGLAEFGCFPAAACRPIPDGMPDEVAAGFQVAFGTSHLALARRGRLAAGETLAVLGASGGAGLAAVEIGRALGARVIAVARGAARRQTALEAGAEIALDSETADLRADLKALGGIDVLYDPVGGAQARAAAGALRPEGRHVVIGFASGEVTEVRANHLLVKNVDVVGVWWGAYAAFAPDVLNGSLDTLTGWYLDGRLKPLVGALLPLERATEGLAMLRDRRATGKVVVTMPPTRPPT